MFLITGGAGFLGSALIWQLNRLGIQEIVVADRLGHSSSKWKNLTPLAFYDFLHKDDLRRKVLSDNPLDDITHVIHLGACSSTTETDADYLLDNNYRYSVELAEWSLRHCKRFLYAGSAAAYGNGKHGFEDSSENTLRLRPLNIYGYSKHLFDLHAIRHNWLSQIVGLRFFNVYGPNEYHKGSMASLMFHAVKQIRETRKLKLFRSTTPDMSDGEQKRDFIYVKDVIRIISWFVENPEHTGFFNVGTGESRTWNELAQAIFSAMDHPLSIEYFDMPDHLVPAYQDRTCADITRLRQAGFTGKLHSIEEAASDYIRHYLSNPDQPLHLDLSTDSQLSSKRSQP